MYRGKRKNSLQKGMAGLVLGLLVTGRVCNESNIQKETNSFQAAFIKECGEWFRDILYVQFMPCGSEFSGESCTDWLVRTQTESFLSLYGMGEKGAVRVRHLNQEDTLLKEEEVYRQEEGLETMDNPELLQVQGTAEREKRMDAVPETKEPAEEEREEFVPHNQRMQVDLKELQDYETLVSQFYTVDANTFIGTGQLDVERLMETDVTVVKTGQEPQILIYHTHSQETFADSVPGEEESSIVGAGEYLAEILREKYGYQVLHHKGQYDVGGREDAYGKALPDLQKLLEEYPSIEVVIDLHRDEMPEETRLVMDLDGRPTARFMFFNGLSRTRQSGDIDYLKNENIETNLAMSFQMKLKCEEYYPGLTRKIYLKGYRYNMHLCPKTLLVELGAQNNTVEEAMNACDPLAHVLDMVLSGT